MLALAMPHAYRSCVLFVERNLFLHLLFQGTSGTQLTCTTAHGHTLTSYFERQCFRTLSDISIPFLVQEEKLFAIWPISPRVVKNNVEMDSLVLSISTGPLLGTVVQQSDAAR